MKGLMMETQLLISSIAQHAEKFHGDREIVSVTADNPRHRRAVAGGEAAEDGGVEAMFLLQHPFRQGGCRVVGMNRNPGLCDYRAAIDRRPWP